MTDVTEHSAATDSSLPSLDELFPKSTFGLSVETYIADKLTKEFCSPHFDYSAFDEHAAVCNQCQGVVEDWCDVGTGLWEILPRLG